VNYSVSVVVGAEHVSPPVKFVYDMLSLTPAAIACSHRLY